MSVELVLFLVTYMISLALCKDVDKVEASLMQKRSNFMVETVPWRTPPGLSLVR